MYNNKMELDMNYKKQLVKFDTAKMINLSIIMFIVPFVALSLLNLFVFGSKSVTTGMWYLDIIIWVVLVFLLVIIHEGLHAVGFLLFGKAKKADISFGIVPKQGMVYCTCKKPMTSKMYLLALILPIVVTGIIPIIIVTIFGNVSLILLFSVMISGGAGDVIMLNQVRKLTKEQLIMDHPKAPAYYLVYEQGKEPNDFVEVTEEMEKEVLEELNKSPFEGKNSKNSLGLKILKILLFISISIIAMAIIGILLML